VRYSGENGFGDGEVGTLISVRETTKECLGLSGTISVNRDVYGYRFRDGNGRLFGQLDTASDPPETLPDTFPATGEPTTRLLGQQLRAIRWKAINLSIYMVGFDGFEGTQTLDQLTRVQYAIQITRDLYVQANLGVRKIYWQRISVARGSKYWTLVDRDHAEEMTDEFTGDNDGIDVFWVQEIIGAGGRCNTDGPCDKYSRDEMTGVAVELSRGRRRTGILLAHELGHYLGLPGGSSLDNLMGMKPPGDAPDDLTDGSTQITSSQAADMRDHCFVRPTC
jgi:hypothetical protein